LHILRNKSHMKNYEIYEVKMELKYAPWNDVFHTSMVDGAKFTSRFEFPILRKSIYTTHQAIPFDKGIRSKNKNQWIHFYTHDRNFECLWRTPNKYLSTLQSFSGVITPDFSLYREMPLAMQIWNTYRNRAIAFWMQKNNIPIIPNVRWGDERTYTFAFEGIPRNSVVAVSTCGCIRNSLDRLYFKKGLVEMTETLQPSAIIAYSSAPSSIFADIQDQGIPIFLIENYQKTVRKAAI